MLWLPSGLDITGLFVYNRIMKTYHITEGKIFHRLTAINLHLFWDDSDDGAKEIVECPSCQCKYEVTQHVQRIVMRTAKVCE